MIISPVNCFSKPKYFLKKPPLNFSGGYKDIFEKEDKKFFDNHLDGLIKSSKEGLYNISKKVVVDGVPARLTIYQNKNYVLKSKDGKIKAVMEIFNSGEPCKNCDNKFYSDNIGNISILLLYSKGSGGGKFLIKEAVKKSLQLGYDGRVTVFASTINKQAGNPIPFYEKMGFKAFKDDLQELIERKMDEFDNEENALVPQYTNMYLDENRIKDYL